MTPFEEWIAAASPEEIERALDIAHDAILRDVEGEEAQHVAMQRTYEIFNAALLKARAGSTLQ